MFKGFPILRKPHIWLVVSTPLQKNEKMDNEDYHPRMETIKYFKHLQTTRYYSLVENSVGLNVQRWKPV
jgi:acyl-ACP thioesterase